jgi:hypothetical protein
MKHALTFALIAAVAGLSFGCEAEDGYANWSTGLKVRGTLTRQTMSEAWVHQEGLNPYAAKGFIDAGNFAGDPNGTRKSVKDEVIAREWHVVGRTKLDNPLIPGSPEFSAVPVAIVEAVDVSTGTLDTLETTVSESPAFQRHTLEEHTNAPLPRATVAYTFGMAGDEYVVRIDDLDLLWDPDLVTRWQDTGTPLAGVEHLVRAGVQVGDFWVSPDGGTLYKAVGRESVDVGGRRVAATKVELRRAGNVGNDRVLDRCLRKVETLDSTWTTEGQPGGNEGETRVTQVELDPGCAAAFTHYRVGYQWWHDDVLVAEDTLTYTVTVTDWGFEWLTFDGGKARRTAKQLPSNQIPSGTYLYVQYDYDTIRTIWKTELLKVEDTPWSD